MANKKRMAGAVLSLAPVLLILSLILSLSFGGMVFRPADLMEMLTGNASGPAANIFWYSRLPRTLACALAGCAMALSGAVLQKVLANPLASPSIIGVNSGAGLGVTVSCALGAVSGWYISLAAFLGSLMAVVTIYVISRKIGASKSTVILSGVVMNSLCNAFSDTVTVLDPDIGLITMEFRVGGFSAVSYIRLVPAGILILLAAAVLFTLTNELDVISLGDETAQGIGMPVKKYRFIFLLLASLLAGAAVSFAGLLGFIGLIVPHFIKKLCGNESRKLMPAAAMTGASFVILCDLGARLLFYPYELPVGLIMALLGAPAFLVILFHTRKRGFHD